MSFKKHSIGKRERLTKQIQRTLRGEGPAPKRSGGNVALRTVTNEALATIWGKPLMVAMEEGEPPKEARVSDMVKALVSNLRGLKGQRLTFNDEEQALLVAQALRASTNGCITFEETPYKWLMELLKVEGPKLFSPNTVMLVKAMEQEVKAPEVTPAGG